MTTKKTGKKDYKVDAHLPEGVVDKESYLKYIELTKSPELNEDRYKILSDGKEIDLLTAMGILRKQTLHLTMEEQDDIAEAASIRRSLIGKAHFFKRKGLGVKGIRSGGNNDSVFTNILHSKEQEIIELFAKFHTAQEVHKVCLEDWGYDVSLKSVTKIQEKNADKIKSMQEVYKMNFTDLRLFHKKSRLEELADLYRSRKTQYEKTKSKDDYRLLLATLEQIRKEAEGDKLLIEGNLDISLEATIQIQIQKQVMKDLNITDIIIGRIAARYSLNPQWLIAKMHASFYSKFNALINNVQYQEEVIYPSQQSYDFDMIGKKHLGPQEKPTPLLEVLSTAQTTKAQSIREKLLKLGQEKNSQIEVSAVRTNKKIS